jgi:Cytochrome P450
MEQQPGKNLVDSYPILSSLPKPLQWWRPRGERIFKKTCHAYEYFQNEMLQKIENGTAKHCFGRMVNQNRQELGFDEVQAMFIGIRSHNFTDKGASVVEAGSDTTRGTLNVVLAAAVAQPDWVTRALKELDSVCGNAHRLPTFADMPQLPYIQAVAKEALRWRPLVDVGVNHMCTEDFEFEQYYFPRGTLFTWNAWAISQNPMEYEDPERFWPERYLDEYVGDILHGIWGFGAGRRGS